MRRDRIGRANDQATWVAVVLLAVLAGQLLQAGDHLRGRARTALGVLGQQLEGQALGLLRHRAALGERRRLLVADGLEQGQVVAATERRPAGQHLVEDATQRPEVAALVDLHAAGLLGRHVGDGADCRARIGEPARRAGQLGEAEVEDLHLAVLGQHEVRRLDVAMDDAGVMGPRQPARHLQGDVDRLADGQRAAGDARPQRLAGVERHGDEQATVLGAVDVVDGADVRVVEGGGAARFAVEAIAGRRVPGEVRRQELERDMALEVRVEGLVHDPHAPTAHLLEDLVVRDRLAGHVPEPLDFGGQCATFPAARLRKGRQSRRVARQRPRRQPFALSSATISRISDSGSAGSGALPAPRWPPPP